MIGEEEKKLVEGLLTFLNKNPIIVDCGANKGHWMDIILNEYEDNCAIHAFEPVHKLIDYLEIKYEYRTNIVYNELAAYQYNGQYDFYYFENFNNELSSLIKNERWEKELPMKTKKVETIRLDKYCEDKGIDYVDYIKIDCEGSDYDILLGCGWLLNKDKVGIIQIEYSEHYKLMGRKFERIISMVNDLGYKVYSYDAETDNYNEVLRETFVEDYHLENYIITKYNIHNYSAGGGWLHSFKESVKELPKFKFMLECGSFEGFTAKYMCENMLEEGGRLIVVDPLQNYYTEETKDVYPDFKDVYQRFLRNTKGLPIELRRQDSRIALPEMHEYRFEFAYIDGEHDISYTDAVNVFPIVSEYDGYILFDDAFGWSDTATAGIERFLSEYEGYYEIIKKDYQLLIKKTKNYHGIIQSSDENI